MNQEKIGKFIAESRKVRNLTQQELAQKLGVSDRTIGNWENGRNMPDLSLFKPLCEELNISVVDLISGEKINSKDNGQKLEDSILKTIDYSNKKIKKAKKMIPKFLVLVAICSIALGFCLFSSFKKINVEDLANWDVEEGYARVYLYADVISNDITNLKYGDKVDIFISESIVNDEVLKNAYIENVEIKMLIDNDNKIVNQSGDIRNLVLTLPRQYAYFTNGLFVTSVKVKVVKSENQNTELKVNEKIFNLLEDEYLVKDEAS
ncbi:MAG: helix-turn-helix domain-containing protein [Bacilli bacterium]|nr:helix-turn-helix domain-containing protein [Bacilli bacterium]